MDFLASEPMVSEPSAVVDFLGEEIRASAEDCFCVACGHGLTAHSRGLLIHDRCLIVGCPCQKAVLTESAARKVKHGLLP
jgi:hypothetical protein